MTKLSIPINERVCIFCKKNWTHDSWYNYENQPVCQICYYREIHYSKYGKERDAKRHPRRVTFKGKRIYSKEKPRTGYCSHCPNNIFDKSCRRTSMHHLKYNEKDVLENTIELCNSCHAYETWKERRKNVHN